MRVAVIGMGYVGCVTAACLAELGHAVVGVDLLEDRVASIRRGVSPIPEGPLRDLMARMVSAGRLSATIRLRDAVADADCVMLTVGTPKGEDGLGVDLTSMCRAAREVGEGIRGCGGKPLVLNRSTVPPGTTWGAVRTELEAGSGTVEGQGFRLCFHPEFLRRGDGVQDFRDSALSVLGVRDAQAEVVATWQALIGREAAPPRVVGMEPAELLKYLCNAYHGMKVAFANEAGRLSHALGLDGIDLMELFCTDRKLNISEAYLRPGFAFGGACLPKDIHALGEIGGLLGVELPLVNALLCSNEAHYRAGLELIVSKRMSRVGLIGLGFKPGSEDLRGSPFFRLAEDLRAEGIELRVWDPSVASALEMQGPTGAVSWLEACLERDLLTMCRACPLVVVNTWGTGWGCLPEVLEAAGRLEVIDFCGALRGWQRAVGGVDRLCW